MNFQGCEKEALERLMKIEIKSLIHSWKADYICFQEPELGGDVMKIVKELS